MFFEYYELKATSLHKSDHGFRESGELLQEEASRATREYRGEPAKESEAERQQRTGDRSEEQRRDTGWTGRVGKMERQLVAR